MCRIVRTQAKQRILKDVINQHKLENNKVRNVSDPHKFKKHTKFVKHVQNSPNTSKTKNIQECNQSTQDRKATKVNACICVSVLHVQLYSKKHINLVKHVQNIPHTSTTKVNNTNERIVQFQQTVL